jgi:hypothetical protein
MAYTTIKKPSDYFNTKLYTGNGGANSSQSITGVGFQPDLVWIKCRTLTARNVLQDIVRGTGDTKLSSNETQAEGFDENDWGGGYISSFNSDGFTANGGTSNASTTNNNGENYVAWNWLASNTTASNTDGSITSTVSANTTSGFSIVSYTGVGSISNVGHGLGVAPKMYMVKRRDAGGASWCVYHASVGNTGALFLNDTASTSVSSSYWDNASPTANVFYLGGTNQAVNANGGTYIAYCFAEVKGFSKFGKFTSNGSDDGTFTYCGFKPAWIMMKANVTDVWSHWFIFDNKRDTYNLADLPQYANLAIQDGYYGGTPATNYSQIDMLSNGFKIRRDGNWGLGGNGTEVIYMAFAEEPLVGDNPATAR